MMGRAGWTLAAAAALTIAGAGYATPAHACGGTFCDNGPQAMPVDQTGENILFVMGDGQVEAHIQIQYDPDTEAAKFAWVIPLIQVPEFEVGSQLLFDAVLGATVPAYGFNTVSDDCRDPKRGDESDPGQGGGDGGGFSLDVGDTGGGPTVVLEQTVGAFDVVVLQGGTVDEVMQWLTDNDYQQDPAAAPILGEYLAEGYLFGAFRLTNGAQTAEIHPVVLRFSTDEACIPLRLTRIAAADDMDIRTFFLGDNRVVPKGYRHVLVNPLRLDWPNQAQNYKAVISAAVDAQGADGNAFVTEYAGPSDIVPTGGLWNAAWDPSPFASLDPVLVIDTLTAQGLVDCQGGFEANACLYPHPLIQGLLAQYLPVPAGLAEGDFYNCLSCFADQIDLTAWDGAAFAAAMAERIVDPGAHARDVVQAWPFLTRMYTTISPAEMMADPFFHQNPDLDEVDLTNSIATRRILCNQDEVWTLPDGREVYAPGGVFPTFDGVMPWEEDVEMTPAAGAPTMLVDNTAVIDSALSTYNCDFSWPTPGDCGQSVPGGDGSGSGGLGDRSSSCACRSSGSLPLLAFALPLLALGLRHRRPR